VGLLDNLALDRLTPSRLWAEVDPQTRRQAAACLYRPDWDDAASRVEADVAIAAAMRFRAEAVRRLPLDKRADYLSRAVRPDDSLAGGLLRALHLVERSRMLGTFLDGLGIPQHDGVIDGDAEIDAPEPEALASTIGQLRAAYPANDVDLYLATLLALDDEFWAGLADQLRVRG